MSLPSAWRIFCTMWSFVAKGLLVGKRRGFHRNRIPEGVGIGKYLYLTVPRVRGLGGDLSWAETLKNAERKGCNLSGEEKLIIWDVSTRRKEGAKKAAATRRQKNKGHTEGNTKESSGTFKLKDWKISLTVFICFWLKWYRSFVGNDVFLERWLPVIALHVQWSGSVWGSPVLQRPLMNMPSLHRFVYWTNDFDKKMSF